MITNTNIQKQVLIQALTSQPAQMFTQTFGLVVA